MKITVKWTDVDNAKSKTIFLKSRNIEKAMNRAAKAAFAEWEYASAINVNFVEDINGFSHYTMTALDYSNGVTKPVSVIIHPDIFNI